jgi:hypothetical protein
LDQVDRIVLSQKDAKLPKLRDLKEEDLL